MGWSSANPHNNHLALRGDPNLICTNANECFLFPITRVYKVLKDRLVCLDLMAPKEREVNPVYKASRDKVDLRYGLLYSHTPSAHIHTPLQPIKPRVYRLNK